MSIDSAGNQSNSDSNFSAISAGGRFVAFDSPASNLVLGDTNGPLGAAFDVFVHDLETGVTERVSVDSAGNQGNGGFGGRSTISADGRFWHSILPRPISSRATPMAP